MNNQQQDTNTNDQAFEEFLVQLEAHEAKLNEERAEDLLVRWDAGDRDFTSVELNILTQYLTHRNAAFEADAERLEAEIQRSKDQVRSLQVDTLRLQGETCYWKVRNWWDRQCFMLMFPLTVTLLGLDIDANSSIRELASDWETMQIAKWFR